MTHAVVRPLALLALLIATAPAEPTFAEPRKVATTAGVEFSETLTLPEFHAVPWIPDFPFQFPHFVRPDASLLACPY